MIQILKKAETRLQQFYLKKSLLAQVGEKQVPGARVAAPPPTPGAYSKAENAGGIMQFLAKIIADAAAEEIALTASEQHAQENYASFTHDTTNSIDASRAAISEKQEAVAKATTEKSETEAGILAKEQELADLKDLLKGQHLDCDFLLKFFDIRQQARHEEMDSIVEAKAILAGADFGK